MGTFRKWLAWEIGVSQVVKLTCAGAVGGLSKADGAYCPRHHGVVSGA